MTSTPAGTTSHRLPVGDATDLTAKLEHQSYLPLGASQGLTIVFAEAADPGAVEAAVARLIAERVDVLYSSTSPLLFSTRKLVGEYQTASISIRPSVPRITAVFVPAVSLAERVTAIWPPG